ncbi:MAG: 2-dehydropantoate 2-reductase [Methanobacteriota archaeon]
MKISVVGPGAIGTLFGGLLSRVSDNKVVLIGRSDGQSRFHLKKISEEGLVLSGKTVGVFKLLETSTNPSEIEPQDLVLITSKTYSVRDAVKSSKPLVGKDTIVLLLQNGLGQEQLVQDIIPLRQLVRGVTSHGAIISGFGMVRHTGVGETVVGSLTSRQEGLVSECKGVFDRAGIQTRISEDIFADVWLKTLVNAGINAIGALYEKTNGQIFKDEETSELAENAISEGELVAKATGITLPENPLIKAISVSKATFSNKNSMWMDIASGRRTEIDAINGYIVSEGKRLGIPTPVNEELTARIKGA